MNVVDAVQIAPNVNHLKLFAPNALLVSSCTLTNALKSVLLDTQDLMVYVFLNEQKL